MLKKYIGVNNMSVSKGSFKLQLGSALFEEVNSRGLHCGFFIQAASALFYYLSLKSGFRILPPDILKDLSLPDYGYTILFKEKVLLSEDLEKLVNDGKKKQYDLFQKLLSSLMNITSEHVSELFNFTSFEEWIDDPIFYSPSQNCTPNRELLQKEIEIFFTKSGSIADKRSIEAIAYGKTFPLYYPPVKHPPESFLRALLYNSSGRVVTAFKVLKELSDCKCSFFADHMCGEFLLRQGKQDEAMFFFRRCADYIHYYEGVIAQAAAYYLKTGDPYLCNQLITCARTLYPKNIMINFVHAELLIETGRKNRALKMLNTIAATGTAFPGLLARLAELSTNEPEKSAYLIDRALEMNPYHKKATYLKAYRMLTEGEYNDALCCLNKALEYYPDSPDLFELRGSVYFAADELEAAESEYLKAALSDQEYLVSLARFYLSSGDYSKAVPVADKILELEPLNAEAMEIKAVYSFNNGNLEAAEKLYTHLNFLFPDRLDYILVLSDLKASFGAREESIHLLQKAWKKNPENEHVRERMGWYYLENRQYKKAEGIFDLYINEGGRENLLILCGKAMLLFRKKQYEEAEKLCREIIENYNECDTAFFILAKIATAQKDYDKARAYIERALELVPSSEKYFELKQILVQK